MGGMGVDGSRAVVNTPLPYWLFDRPITMIAQTKYGSLIMLITLIALRADKNPGELEKATVAFKRVSDAWDVLSDVLQRAVRYPQWRLSKYGYGISMVGLPYLDMRYPSWRHHGVRSPHRSHGWMGALIGDAATVSLDALLCLYAYVRRYSSSLPFATALALDTASELMCGAVLFFLLNNSVGCPFSLRTVITT